MVNFSISLKRNNARIIDSNEQLISFVVFHGVRIDSVGLQLGRLLQEQKFSFSRCQWF